MLTITTFIVDRNGSFEYVSNRSSGDYSRFNSTFDLTAWLGQSIRVVNSSGQFIFDGVVVAKSVMVWDFKRPMGMRLLSCKQTNEFERFFHLACDQHNLNLSGNNSITGNDIQKIIKNS